MALVTRSEFVFNDGRKTPTRQPSLRSGDGAVASDAYADLLRGTLVRQGGGSTAPKVVRPFVFDGVQLTQSTDDFLFFDAGTVSGTVGGKAVLGTQSPTTMRPWLELLAGQFPGVFKEKLLSALPGFAVDCVNCLVTGASNPSQTPIKQNWFVVGQKIAVINSYLSPVTDKWAVDGSAVTDLAEFATGGPAGFVFATLVYSSQLDKEGRIVAYAVGTDGKYYQVKKCNVTGKYGYVTSLVIDSTSTTAPPFYGWRTPLYTSFVPLMQQVTGQKQTTPIDNVKVYALFPTGTEAHWASKLAGTAEHDQLKWLDASDLWERPFAEYKQTAVFYRRLLPDAQGNPVFRVQDALVCVQRSGTGKWTTSARSYLYNARSQLQQRQVERPRLTKLDQGVCADPNPLVHTLSYAYAHDSDERFVARNDYVSLTKAASALQDGTGQWTDMTESYEYQAVGGGRLQQDATVSQYGPANFARQGVALAFNERGQPLVTRLVDAAVDTMHNTFVYANAAANHIPITSFSGVSARLTDKAWSVAAGVLYCADYVETVTTFASGMATVSSTTLSVANATPLKAGPLHQWSFLVDKKAAVTVLPSVLVDPAKNYTVKVVFAPVGDGQLYVTDLSVIGQAVVAAGGAVPFNNAVQWVVDAVYFYESGGSFTDTVLRDGMVRFALDSSNRLISSLVGGSSDNDVFYTFVSEQTSESPARVWRIGTAVALDQVALSNAISEPSLLKWQSDADIALRVTTLLSAPHKSYAPAANDFSWPVGQSDSWAVCFDTRTQLALQFYDSANAKQVNLALDDEGLRLDIGGDEIVSKIKTSMPRVGTFAVVGNQLMLFVDGALLKIVSFDHLIIPAQQRFSAAIDTFNALHSGIVFLEGFTLGRRYADLRGNVLQVQQLIWQTSANDNALVLWDANRSAVSDQQAVRVSDKALFFAHACPPDVAFLRYTKDALVIKDGAVSGPIATFYQTSAGKWFAPFATADSVYPYHLGLNQVGWPQRSVSHKSGYLGAKYPVTDTDAETAGLPFVTDAANASYTARTRSFASYVNEQTGVTRTAAWSLWSAPEGTDRVDIVQASKAADYAVYANKYQDNDDFYVTSTVTASAASADPLQFITTIKNRYGNVASRLRSDGKLAVAVSDLLNRPALFACGIARNGSLHPNDPVAYVRYDASGRIAESGTLQPKETMSFADAVALANQAGFPQSGSFAGLKKAAVATYFDGSDAAFANSPKSFAENSDTGAYVREFGHEWNQANASYDATEAWSVNGKVRHSTRTSFAGGSVVSEAVSIGSTALQFDYAYDDAGRLASVSLKSGKKPALAVVKTVTRNFEGRLTGLTHETAKGDLAQVGTLNIDRSLKRYAVSLAGAALLSEDYTYGLESGPKGYAAGNVVSRTVTAFGSSVTTAYAYDDANRLAEATLPRTGQKTTYAYNACSELVSVQNGSTTVAYAYDRHTPARVGGITLTNNGVDVTALTGADAPVDSVAYDPFGHVAKVTKGKDSVALERDTEGKLVTATVTLGGKTTKVLFYHDWGGTLRCYWIGGDFFYNIYANERLVGQYSSATETVSYFVDSADGSKMASVDQSGKTTDFGVYDDFGKPLFAPDGVVRFLYAGYLYFPAFGFYVTGSRLYFPALRLYLQQDPALAEPWVSPYAYAKNNPIANEDRTGLAPTRKWFMSLLRREEKFKKRVVDGEEYYTMELRKFIRKYSKDGVRLVEDRIYDHQRKFTAEIVTDITRADVEFTLGEGARVFLENAMHTNAFTGIGDVASRKLFLHPLYSEGPTDDYDSYPYEGPYDPSYPKPHLPIRHHLLSKAKIGSTDPDRGTKYLDSVEGGPSHRQFATLLREKGLAGHDVFGFAIMVNTTDWTRNPSGWDHMINGRRETQSVIRIASRSTNGFETGALPIHFNSRLLQVTEIDGKRRVVFLRAQDYENPETLQRVSSLRPGLDAPLDGIPWAVPGTKHWMKFLSQRLIASISRSIAAEMGYTAENDPLGLLNHDDSTVYAR